MAKPDVLDRVAADLAHGRTQPAIQRLSSLVAVHPTDLELRRRLAALHRMVGNRIEAGRWDYLTPGANRTETAAFERAFPSAGPRLAALRWPQRAVANWGTRGSVGAAAATEYARSRLDALIHAAGENRRPGTDTDHRLRPWRRAGLAIVGVATAFFAVLGAVTVVQLLVP
jgi:hypothetical protein